MSEAHIIFPSVEVGEKAMTLCGKKHKVKVKFISMGADHEVCTPCAQVAVDMLTDAAALLAGSASVLGIVTEALADVEIQVASTLLADHIAQANAYQDKRDEKAIEKAVAKAAKKKKD